MKNILIKEASKYLKDHKKRRILVGIVAILSAVTIFGVNRFLTRPAISMENRNLILTASPSEAEMGNTMTVKVSAIAREGQKFTSFLIMSENTGAGLTDDYSFDENGIVEIETLDNKVLKLHRFLDESDKVDYYFTLKKGQAVSFTLNCISDAEEGTMLASSSDAVSDSLESKLAGLATSSNAGTDLISDELDTVATATASDLISSKAATQTIVKTTESTASGSDAAVTTTTAAADDDTDTVTGISDGEVFNNLEPQKKNTSEQSGKEETASGSDAAVTETREIGQTLTMYYGSGATLKEAYQNIRSKVKSLATGSNATDSDAAANAELKLSWYYVQSELKLVDQTLSATIYSDASYSAKADLEDGTQITISGAMPVGATIKAYPVNVTLEDKTVLAAYDITIFDKYGNKFEPEEDNPVAVNIATPALQNVESADVYHMENEQAVPETVVTDVKPTDNKVDFEANKFSIYIVTAIDDKPYNYTLIGDLTSIVKGEIITVGGNFGASYADSVWTVETAPDSTNNIAGGNATISKVSEQESPHGKYAQITGTQVGRIKVTYTYKKQNHKNTDSEVVYLYVVEKAQLTTVDTIDSTTKGVTMRMIDYGSAANIGGGAYTVDNNTGNIKQGLLTAKVGADGYPATINGNTSLSTWFSDGKAANHLFLKSVYDDTKYFYYSGSDNFAHFDTSSGDFTVYDQLGTPDNDDKFYYKRGNFMPYNNLDISNVKNHNLYDYLGNALSSSDSRYNENLYGFTEGNDFYFGMYLAADFLQPENGLVNGSAMRYEFTGDDDLWVYIDGKLVLDLGGIHDAQSGYIDFNTGEVMYTTTSSSGATPTENLTTIKAMYEAAEKDSTATGFKGNTFEDFSQHSMQMFYMERGAGASNLRVKFNIPTMPKKSVSISKEVDNLNAVQGTGKTYSFKFYLGTADSQSLQKDAAYTVLKNGVETRTGTTSATDGIFTLAAGETAVFADIDADKYYRFEENGSDGNAVKFRNSAGVVSDATDSSINTGYKKSPVCKSGTSMTMLCKNDFSNLTGGIKVTKKFSGTATVDTPPANFAATYNLYEANENNSGKKNDTVIATEDYSNFIQESDGSYSHTFEHLLAGKSYWLEEIVTGGDTDYLKNSSKLYADHQYATVMSAGSTANITVTNVYTVPTISLEIKKVSQNNPSVVLSGAKFRITDANGTTIVENLESDSNGSIVISNQLHLNTMYQLIETKAPEGYNMLTGPIVFKLLKDNGIDKITVDTSSSNYSQSGVDCSTNDAYILKVFNSTGAKLPNSGGPGTTLFTMLGILLMMMASVVYRKSKLEERRQGN